MGNFDSSYLPCYDKTMSEDFPASINADVVASFMVRPEGEPQPKQSAVMTFEELNSQLTEAEKTLISQLSNLDPLAYGFKGEYLGLEDVPKDMVALEGQIITREGEQHTLRPQYLPGPVFDAWQNMATTYKAETGRYLVVESGYSSPAFQMITLVSWLKRHNNNLEETLQHVALPAYSQHCSASQTALDVLNQDGEPKGIDPEEFIHTPDYAWLKQHAAEYGFVESYPENNELGVRWEPWHWQYTGTPER